MRYAIPQLWKLGIAVALKEVSSVVDGDGCGREGVGKLLREGRVHQDIVSRHEDLCVSDVGFDSRHVDVGLANKFVKLWDETKLLHKPRDNEEPRKLPLALQCREIVQHRGAAQAMRDDASISVWTLNIVANRLYPLIELRSLRFRQRDGVNGVAIGGQQAL